MGTWMGMGVDGDWSGSGTGKVRGLIWTSAWGRGWGWDGDGICDGVGDGGFMFESPYFLVLVKCLCLSSFSSEASPAAR